MAGTESPQVRSITVFDTRVNPHEDVLAHVERAFGVVLDRDSVVHGLEGVTEGFRTDRGTWVRIEQRLPWRIKSAAWIGLEASSAIEGVPKPAWFQSVTWTDQPRDRVWRADEVEFVATPSVAVAGGLQAAAALPHQWWTGLRQALDVLAGHRTERVGVTQAHLSTRIGQVFPDVDTTIDEWVTAHTDLHWRNVTTDGVLLDWADWGLAPRGHDVATLWQASLPHPELAARVEREFAADFATRSGKLSRLLLCANAIRIADQRGVTTPFVEPARTAARQLVAELMP
ncbi:phosphotransferase [Actinosynnema sp. CA-248983]